MSRSTSRATLLHAQPTPDLQLPRRGPYLFTCRYVRKLMSVSNCGAASLPFIDSGGHDERRARCDETSDEVTSCLRRDTMN